MGGAFRNMVAWSSMRLVGHGHARLAVFEFERGVDEEGFDHLPDLVRVLENVPGVGAVAPSLEADIAHHGEERGLSFGSITYSATPSTGP